MKIQNAKFTLPNFQRNYGREESKCNSAIDEPVQKQLPMAAT